MRRAVTIRPSDVGKRVTVQFYDDEGARVEAIGVLERAEVEDERVFFSIRRRDDSVVRVALDRIRHGKVVTPPRR